MIRAEAVRKVFRGPTWPLLAIALAAAAIRLIPLLCPSGLAGHMLDHDEGVYFSAAALWAKGVLPYRDFLFVHPPGLLWALLPFGWLGGAAGQDVAFEWARGMGAVLGGATAFLLGRVGWRAGGPAAGIAAAAGYALFPAAIAAECGVFLEPLLNLLCVAFAALWLRSLERGSRPWAAGAALGAALAVELWAGAWVLAALASVLRERRPRPLWIAAAAAAVTLALLLSPFLATAPRELLEGVVLFQLRRPPDGIGGALERLRVLWDPRQLAILPLALLALLPGPDEARDAGRRARWLFGVAALGIGLALLSSPSFWPGYLAHLAPAVCLLAGLGASRVWRAASPSLGRGVALGIWAMLLAPNARWAVRSGLAVAQDQLRLAELLRPRLGGGCVFSFDSGWSLLAGVVGVGRGPPWIVDPHAEMLARASAQGVYASAGMAMLAPAAQEEILAAVRRCDLLVLGWRGHWQLGPEAMRDIESEYQRVSADDAVIDLWARRREALRPAP